MQLNVGNKGSYVSKMISSDFLLFHSFWPCTNDFQAKRVKCLYLKNTTPAICHGSSAHPALFLVKKKGGGV